MVMSESKANQGTNGTNGRYAYQKANSSAMGGRNNNDDEDDKDCQCCSLSGLKFSLHLFNAVFFLTGIALAGVGVWTLIEKHPSLVLLTSGLYDLTAYILILAGILVLVVTLVGCCGISRESHSLVLTYSLLLSLIFLAEVGAGVLAYLYRESLSNELSGTLTMKFHQNYGIENTTTIAVDHLQIRMKCCGVQSFEDWQKSGWWQLPERRNNKVPDSCCITPSAYCGASDHPSNIRYTGCIDRVGKIAGDHLIIVGAVALGVCLVQLMGTLLACVLHCKLKELTHYG